MSTPLAIKTRVTARHYCCACNMEHTGEGGTHGAREAQRDGYDGYEYLVSFTTDPRGVLTWFFDCDVKEI